jgi:hypothetical protein
MYEFFGLPPEVCPDCDKARQEKLQQVRTLLKEQPLSAQQVHLKTGVPIPIILEMIRSGDVETG